MKVDLSRTSSKMQGSASDETSKEPDSNYVATQRGDGYTSGDGLALGNADSYSIMSGYYPYYTTPEDMNAAAAMWSAGDVMSPAAISYGYNPMDYAAMMASYAGYGWYPGAGGSGGWETGMGAMKNDPSASYGAASGFYGMEPVSVGYGNDGWANGRDQEADVNAVEQSMEAMHLKESRHAAGSAHAANGSSGGGGGGKSWATVVGQPSHSYAGKQRGMASTRVLPGMANVWDGGETGRHAHDGWSASRRRPPAMPSSTADGGGGSSQAPDARQMSTARGFSSEPAPKSAELNRYNPKEFDLNPKAARFFIIKSFAEDDIHRSIKYNIWCSTEYGNKRLDLAYREREGKGPIFLLFSVNGSGHFCGIAQMTSPVDYESSAEVWQLGNRWKGQFAVKWIYVKDVPNSQLRHIRLENNEGKPVTNSRDTQEVPPEKGCQVLRVIHQYRHTTSIFDDFSHYEKSQTSKREND